MPCSPAARFPGRCSVRSSALVPSRIVSNPRSRRDFAESGPELGLAEVAAIGGIGTIARIGQLTGFHFEQRDIEAPSQIDGRSVLDLGIRHASADDREKAVGAKHPSAYNREKRRVHAPE